MTSIYFVILLAKNSKPKQLQTYLTICELFALSKNAIVCQRRKTRISIYLDVDLRFNTTQKIYRLKDIAFFIPRM